MTDVNNATANSMVDTRYFMTAIDVLSFGDFVEDPTTLEDPTASEDHSVREDKVIVSAVVGAVTLDSKITRDIVCLDSGASSSVFNDPKWFDDLTELDRPVKIAAANSSTSNLALGGTITLSCNRSCSSLTNLVISDAILSNNTPLNLVSSGQLRRCGAVFNGLTDQLVVKTTHQEVA